VEKLIASDNHIYSNSNNDHNNNKNSSCSNIIYNNNNNTDNMKETSNTSYKELLELKIRNQAKRLCELQDYKSLCEKRLLQVCPGHPLPIEEKHLGVSFNNSNSNYNNNNFSFEENKMNLKAYSENFIKSSFDKVK